MSINKSFINKNKKSILIMIIAIIIFILIDMFVVDNTEDKLLEKDLPTGDASYTKLVINEIMTSNSGAVASEDGDVSDWIEIYNGNDYDINLKNYGLSDRNNKTKWAFPEVTIKAKSYLVVYLTGQSRNGLYANFKLSSGGESLFFVNAKGKVIDAIDIKSIKKNEVMARDLNGTWFETAKATPGFANTKEGYEEYKKSLIVDGTVKINEVLPKNDGNFKNSYGDYSGYIEIINNGDATNLNGYCISNDIDVPFKYCLSDVTLGKGEIFTIYMDDYDTNDDEIYSGFNLKSKTGAAVLTNNKGKIIDKLEYKNIPNGIALVYEDENFFETSNISPGYENTSFGIDEFSKHKLKSGKTLIINEVMNNNYSYLPQNGYTYYDWIELKNNSNETINLKDYYLTNNDDNLKKFNLPDVSLKSGEYYIIMASGDTNLSNNSYAHANFKLSDVESLYLVKGNDIIDSIFIANVPLGYSLGKKDYGVYYFKTPTPNGANGTGVNSVAYIPKYNTPSGVYNDTDGINLEMNGNGTIYYTLDGSTPTTKSKVYDGPILLNKTTVVKAMSYKSGKLESDVVTLSYIINENHTLPVMSVSLQGSDFNRIQNNPWNEDLEVSAYAELYENGKSFSIPCGLKLFGGSTRGLAKKSYSLKFRKKYGEGSLNYQVFENRDYSNFDTLVLRSGSQDQESAFIRDILMTSLVDGVTNLKVQAYKPIILYINGEYYGVYNIREKVDETFISNNYNVDPSKSNIVRIDNNVTVGSITKYSDLIKYVQTHDLSIQSNYEYVKSILDIESYADFWAAENWITNNDIVNTRFYWHEDVDSGKIKMIFYDLDFAMWNYNLNYFNFTVQPDGMSRLKVPTTLMRALIKNDEFKDTLLTRISYQLKKVWNKERVLKKIDELYNMLKPEMERNQKRYNMTMQEWENNIEELRKYTNLREDYLKKTAKSFFNLSNAEMEKYFGD